MLSGVMIGTFKYFENVKVLNDLEKNVFNVSSTMIYLTMGLNLAVSLLLLCLICSCQILITDVNFYQGAFKGMATMLRWKLLARKSHNLIEVG